MKKLIKDKNFEIYRHETSERKKKSSNGYICERRRIIRYKKKKIFELKTKRKEDSYIYEIFAKEDFGGELIELRLTYGELTCKTNREYLKQIIGIIKNIIFEGRKKKITENNNKLKNKK